MKIILLLDELIPVAGQKDVNSSVIQHCTMDQLRGSDYVPTYYLKHYLWNLLTNTLPGPRPSRIGL